MVKHSFGLHPLNIGNWHFVGISIISDSVISKSTKRQDVIFSMLLEVNTDLISRFFVHCLRNSRLSLPFPSRRPLEECKIHLSGINIFSKRIQSSSSHIYICVYAEGNRQTDRRRAQRTTWLTEKERASSCQHKYYLFIVIGVVFVVIGSNYESFDMFL